MVCGFVAFEVFAADEVGAVLASGFVADEDGRLGHHDDLVVEMGWSMCCGMGSSGSCVKTMVDRCGPTLYLYPQVSSGGCQCDRRPVVCG